MPFIFHFTVLEG